MKTMDRKIFSIQFVDVYNGLFTFSLPCPAVSKFSIGSKVKPLSEIGIFRPM